MPTGHIMMAMSLDGFVARTDHRLDWLEKQPTEEEDHGFAAFQDSVDVIVMGSGSYRTVRGFGAWPYTKPVVVLSRTMTAAEIPDHLRDKVEVSDLAPEDLMKSFDARGFNRVYVDGGAIIRSFLKAGLVEDMRITLVPILIGEGIRIFGETEGDVDLELVSVNSFPSGLVDLDYRLKAA
ncbi:MULTISPECIES: dihydrofolate reductase family protein [Phaeobacter]|uniref:Dihydrofolate reductase n=1 Tax=Phaeobacter piscinae TaxID=1580596 RepID=A0ABM6PEC3_9RHOB|nr:MULTISPECIES: dihydrofolate reductase family protein [Phaeobacter]ATG35921.1 Dihydrofolate reductase [Phaeobacter piscinae]ATG39920.1 Dihydrofolate reductase [Phaeobacter piscinae]AUQ86442.1 Dihydrofolate reductase [Phaeobacter piscinae]AUR24325.1 Dihydrofolate reductase [Phaeobacter piscinae]KII13685.1 deaminase/reductase [Phaeobacter sp. S60]